MIETTLTLKRFTDTSIRRLADDSNNRKDLEEAVRTGFKLGMGSRQNAPAEWIGEFHNIMQTDDFSPSETPRFHDAQGSRFRNRGGVQHPFGRNHCLDRIHKGQGRLQGVLLDRIGEASVA